MTSPELFSQDGNPNSWGLLVDTSSVNGVLLAVSSKGEVLNSLKWDKTSRHSSTLLSNFLNLSLDLGKQNLKHIFFVQGPGSFTGLRVGAAFIKTLSFALGELPITSCSSFAPIACNVISNKKTLDSFNVLIPSIGKKSFSASFRLNDNVWNEVIDFEGANESAIDLENKFSISNYSNASVQRVNQNINDLVLPFLSTTNIHTHLKTHTYLDLYPLYLRQSEAEEKNRYDKVKL